MMEQNRNPGNVSQSGPPPAPQPQPDYASQPYPYQPYQQPPPQPQPRGKSKTLLVVVVVVVVIIVVLTAVAAVFLMNLMRNAMNEITGGDGDDGNDGNNPPPSNLSPPTNVYLYAGDGYVRINWDPVSNATSYNLYWGLGPSVSKQTGTKISSVHSPYNHTGLTNGQTYYYVITSVNGTRESNESAMFSATPTGQTYAEGPIIIQSDSDFTPAKGVVRGSGTQGDPYIIEGWNIDASRANTSEYPYIKVGIHITGTTAHFVIRSCYIHDAGDYGSGVSLGSLKNGKIEDCMVTNCSSGISVGACTDIMIERNSIGNCEEGISLGGSGYSSARIRITNNSIWNCTGAGIYFHYLYDSAAEHNLLINTTKGIYVSDCENCTVAYNEVTQMSFEGISVHASLEGYGNNTIAYNNVHDNQGNGIGIYSENNTVVSNNCSNNAGCGIILDRTVGGLDANYNLVIGNTANNNIQDGIRVCAYCTGNTVANNTCFGNNANNQQYGDGTPYYYDIYIDELGNTVEGNAYGTIYIRTP